MTDPSHCNWVGVSGTSYTYYVWPRQPNIKAGEMGNYIYAKKNAQGLWVPVHIGEGDRSARCTNAHHQLQCINEKGATNVHVHLNAGQDARWAGEEDLLARYTNAIVPHGCNKAPKG